MQCFTNLKSIFIKVFINVRLKNIIYGLEMYKNTRILKDFSITFSNILFVTSDKAFFLGLWLILKAFYRQYLPQKLFMPLGIPLQHPYDNNLINFITFRNIEPCMQRSHKKGRKIQLLLICILPFLLSFLNRKFSIKILFSTSFRTYAINFGSFYIVSSWAPTKKTGGSEDAVE